MNDLHSHFARGTCFEMFFFRWLAAAAAKADETGGKIVCQSGLARNQLGMPSGVAIWLGACV